MTQQHQEQVHREDVSSAIALHDLETVEEGYSLIKRRLIRQSDYDALTWAITHICIIIAEICIVYILVQQGTTTGGILAALIYVWKGLHRSYVVSQFFTSLKRIRVSNDFLDNQV